jgi:RNase H-like domain found in reverse transcriptase
VILKEETCEKGTIDPRPIAFLSRNCNAAERNYSPTEREALAVVWAIKLARPYVERTKFVVRTDHQALRWLFASSHENNSRLVRWRLCLAEYEFTVDDKPGAVHKVPDALSRLETEGLDSMPLNTDLPALVVESPSDREIELLPPPTVSATGPRVKLQEGLEPISLDELLQSQSECSWCQDLTSRIGQKDMDSFYLNENGALCYCGSDREPSGVRYAAPAELRERILVLGHYPALACHPGSTRFAVTPGRPLAINYYQNITYF